MRYFFVILSVACLLSACNEFRTDKYQMTASTAGNVYRLDKATGEVWLISGNKMQQVQAEDFKLKVGQRYVGEDSHSVVYLGKGQVGDVKFIPAFSIK